MASAHITVARTAGELAAELRAVVDQMRTVQERVVKVKDVMDQIALGLDWASLATALGTDATDAEAVYNLWTAVLDDVTSADYNALIDRLGLGG